MDFGKQPGYKNVSLSDDHEMSRSSTEIGSVSGDEKQWRSRDGEPMEEGSRGKRLMAKFRRYRYIIDTVLLLVNISLSLLLVRDFWREKSVSTIQVGGSFDGTGPDFPTKVVKFNADPLFVPSNVSEFFSNETIAQWNTMMPAGTGWGEPTEDTFFTTTMTHQLHCLFMMARIYSSLVTNSTEHLASDYHSHYLHCVDYLRQGIMCSGDMAMEPHEQTDPDDNGPLDGSWNGHHVCKDYSHVIPYLEEQISEGIRKVLPIDD